MSYKEHQNLLNRFLLDVQLKIPDIRFFKRHVGLFYTRRGTPVKINHSGMADLWALYKTENGLLHIEAEVKSGNAKQTKKQKDWENFIKTRGGIYLIVRDDYNTTINQLKKQIGRV